MDNREQPSIENCESPGSDRRTALKLLVGGCAATALKADAGPPRRTAPRGAPLPLGINPASPTYSSTDHAFLAGTHSDFSKGYDPAADTISGTAETMAMFNLAGGVQNYTILTSGPVKNVRFAGGDPVRLPDGTWQITGKGAMDTMMKMTPLGPPVTVALVRTKYLPLYRQGERFDPDFLDAIDGFGTFRAMQWMSTNRETLTVRRPQPKGNQSGFVAPELIADLCSKKGMAAWLNIHHSHTDAEILDIAAAAEKHLATGLQLGFEWSNEFGWSFHQRWAIEQAQQRYGAAEGAVQRYYGYRVGMMGNLLRRVSRRAVIHMGGRWTFAKQTPDMLKGFDESGCPRAMIATWNVAPYIWPTDKAAWLDAAYANNIAAGVAELVKCQARFSHLFAVHVANARLCSPTTKAGFYESGPSLVGNARWERDPARRPQLVAFNQAVAHHQDTAALVMKNIDEALAAGFDGPLCAFQTSGAGGESGIWGAWPSSQDPNGFPIGSRYRDFNRRAAASLRRRATGGSD